MQMRDELDLIFNDVKEKIGNINSQKLLFSGINSSIYLLEKKSTKIILKIFNRNNKNIIDRFSREILAYKLFEDNNFKYSAKILHYCENMRYILLSYIEGEKICSFNFDLINEIFNFNDLFRRGKLLFSHEILNASESALDIFEFYKNIYSKLDFIKGKFLRMEDNDNLKFVRRIKEDYEKIQIDHIVNIPKLAIKDQVFSQSDVGIHNCLLRGKKLFFMDFEHSGWDDPAKQLSDWVLRPNCGLSEIDSINLINFFINKWGDVNLRERIILMLPLINIKWMLIRLSIGLKDNKSFLDMHINEIIYKCGIEKNKKIIDSLKFK